MWSRATYPTCNDPTVTCWSRGQTCKSTISSPLSVSRKKIGSGVGWGQKRDGRAQRLISGRMSTDQQHSGLQIPWKNLHIHEYQLDVGGGQPEEAKEEVGADVQDTWTIGGECTDIWKRFQGLSSGSTVI